MSRTASRDHGPIPQTATSREKQIAPLRETMRPRRRGTTSIDSRDTVRTSTGLDVRVALTYDSWERLGRSLMGMANASAWHLGDWLIFGQDRYDDRYREGVERAGLDYQTLRNYAWVARRFEQSRRRAGLSFQHHAEVASFPPPQQDMWLNRAERLGWSRNELRRRLREEARLGPSDSRTIVPSFEVPRDCLESWARAADSSGARLDEWMVATLDEAVGVAEPAG
jgi:hypothetical protein